ncbi:hypothetical protein O4G73_13090 [Erythrobacter sp. G21629-S1]|nr:hypothetical protein [Erythrobacter sp. G21629-S1]
MSEIKNSKFKKCTVENQSKINTFLALFFETIWAFGVSLAAGMALIPNLVTLKLATLLYQPRVLDTRRSMLPIIGLERFGWLLAKLRLFCSDSHAFLGRGSGAKYNQKPDTFATLGDLTIDAVASAELTLVKHDRIALRVIAIRRSGIPVPSTPFVMLNASSSLQRCSNGRIKFSGGDLPVLTTGF